MRRGFIAMVVSCLCSVFLADSPAPHNELIAFWDTPRYGASSFNVAPPDEAYFRALKATGATWARVAFAKWRGEGPDFLLKNVDHYEGLSKSDLAVLIRVLDAAEAAGMKVVVTSVSLPGSRWEVLNNKEYDDRLWNDKAYWAQSEAFWRDLALAIKGHPAVVGYNVITEPVPEYDTGLDQHSDADAASGWYAEYAGTSHDLPLFYTNLITAIRQVDGITPIMVDAGWYADAGGFEYWPSALRDKKVLYAFHMYEPYKATSLPNATRNPPYRYPGVELRYGPRTVVWDKAMVAKHMARTFDWAHAHGIPDNRVVASEFGCMRQWVDCATYLRDVLDVLDGYQTHWAFYSFREDGWDGMDYELAPEVQSGDFYWKIEQGKGDELKRTPHPLLDIIEAHIKPIPNGR